jgi:hypothetical protein
MEVALTLAGIAGGALALWAGVALLTGRFMVENAHYSTTKVWGTGLFARPYAVRRYAPALMARVRVEGTSDVRLAASAAFRSLAGYIFGGNTARSSSSSSSSPLNAGGSQKIAMTSPVVSQPMGAGSSKIAMTSPVVSQPVGGGGGSATHVDVSFILPSQYTSTDDLPVPHNAAVKLEALPARWEAVYTWTGSLPSGEQFDAHARTLLQELRAQGLVPARPAPGEGVAVDGGVAVIAKSYAYDPPWTPPFMRRNEVAIVLEEPTGQ